VVRRASAAAAVTLHPCGRPGRFEATGEIGPAVWVRFEPLRPRGRRRLGSRQSQNDV